MPADSLFDYASREHEQSRAPLAARMRPRTLDEVVGQAHLTKGLLDRVVHRLFQVGLSLQVAADLPGHVARERLTEALDQLDDAIHEIRDYAFVSGDEGPYPEPGPNGTGT